MFRQLSVCLLFALIGITQVHAQEQAEDRGPVRAVMHAFVTEIATLKPYLVSKEAFTSEKGKAEVGPALTRLAAKVNHPPPPLLKDSQGFRITYGLLADHIQKTKSLYDKGEYEYARLRLNGTTNLCASCHTQTPSPKKNSLFPPFDDLTAKVSYENADFLFVLRRYEQALAEFDVLIREYPNSKLPPDLLSEVLRRKVAIFARALRDPAAGAASFKEDLKNSKLPSDMRENIKDWIAGFEKLSAEKQNPEKLLTPKLIDYVVKRLPVEPGRKIPNADPQLLNLLYISGLLYERLFQEPNGPQTQQLLYYLSVCERSLSPVVWYSMNEIYLKECVVRFPKQPFSKKCFDAYKEGMQERYSGKLPEPVQQSVDALKDYL
ncbi:MAG: tetratricopeptide repeat protein [Bdellovibrionales bacterium]